MLKEKGAKEKVPDAPAYPVTNPHPALQPALARPAIGLGIYGGGSRPGRQLAIGI
jgi:hypothetical protein